MEIPYPKIFKFFKVYDTNVTQRQLNKTAEQFLTKVGLCPDVVNIWSYLKTIPLIVSLHLLMFGQLGHLLQFLQNNSFSFVDIADDIAVILSTETISIVMIIVSVNAPYLKEICKTFGDFTHPDFGRPPGVEALDKLFGKCVRGIFILFTFLGIVTFLYNVFDDCAPDEVSDCGFVFLPYLPYIDIYNKPWRQIWSFCQVCPYAGGAMVLVLILQYAFINEVIILHYAHLEDIIKQVPLISDRDRHALIGRIVRYHDYLIGVNFTLNRNLGKAYALHLCVTPINMSIIIFQLFGSEVNIISVAHIASYVVVVSVTCCSGERLSTFTDTIRHTIFESVPLDDLKSTKSLQLVLLRAERPLAITAGGVAVVDHIMMVNLYKSVWSILTVLNKTE